MTTHKVTNLKNWEKNPRRITKERFEELKTQIKRLGKYKPLLVTDENVVVGGNMRLRALQDLGVTEIECNVLSFTKTDEGYRVSVNGNQEGDGVFESKEQAMLEYALSDNDASGTYVEEEVSELVNLYRPAEIYTAQIAPATPIRSFTELETPQEDEVPPVTDTAVSILGTIYQLGDHRLMCGDSGDMDTVEKLMGTTKADMVFTDPPYGVDYEGKTKEKLKIDNDADTFIETFENAMAVMPSKSGASYYVCTPPANKHIHFERIFQEYCHHSATIIWVKNSMVLGHGDYHFQHEPILYGWDKRGTHQWHGDRSQTTVWNIDRPSKSEEHPTMEPIALVARAIENSSKSQDVIYDPFGGSGTTLVAAHQTGRICYTVEIDPHYVDVIRKRYWMLVNEGSEDGWEEGTPAIKDEGSDEID